MTDRMEIESNRQDLAGRLVGREIYYCVSYLVSAMSGMAQHDSRNWRERDLDWEDDILPLLERYDIERAGEDYIEQCDDLDELERMVDLNGYWSDALAAANAPEGCNAAEWFESLEDESAALEAMHKYIIDITDDWNEFCEEFNVDYREDEYRDDVYEHWLISGWLAEKLKARGEVVGDLCGLTIWGRCCTGQSIALDRVIQEIAMETWPEDVVKPEGEASENQNQ